MAKIYTRTGDTGDTGLIGGGRARKDNLRVAAYGDVDELNAAIGLARAELSQALPAVEAIDLILVRLQHQLFNLGAELATASTSATTGGGATRDFANAMRASSPRTAPRTWTSTESRV